MRVVVASESCICCISSRPLRLPVQEAYASHLHKTFPEIDDEVEPELNHLSNFVSTPIKRTSSVDY